MSYTIKTASWANEDNSAAIINTEEVGHKAISKADTPDAWDDLQAWVAAGNVIRPYGEGTAYKAAQAKLKVDAERKDMAEKKLSKLNITADDIRAILS